MAPQTATTSTHYALVIDAGSSGSRLQVYSWRDPGLERAEILAEVREARAAGLGSGESSSSSLSGSRTWWWWDRVRGKGKASAAEMEQRALRRLVRVGKGVDGEEWVKRVEPGISSQDPDDIADYLAPLIAHALHHVPPSQQPRTPIYVLATAGMRLKTADEQAAILRATCETLRRESPFVLAEASAAGPCGDSVRVISGEEEGIWGWVAVNYLMDGFGHAPTLPHAPGQETHDHLLPLAPLADPPTDSDHDKVTPVDVSKHSPTFGFLDMGGASTQLAFSPTPDELLSSRFPTSELATISLRLLSGELVEWPVFAASWLGFGTNRVRERYIQATLKDATTITPQGPSHPPEIHDACLPAGLSLPQPEGPTFVGTGNFSQCLTNLKPILAHDAPCPTHHCLFGGLPTPHIDFARHDQRGFIGVSEYWYTAQQVLGLGGVWDWAEWERRMGNFCAQDWTEIESQVKDATTTDPSRLQMQCFKGAWISNVLHEGIGIPRLFDAGGNDTLTGGEVGDTNAEAERRAREKGLLSKHHFQSMDEVGSTAISWTLGKVVIEASRGVGPLAGPSRLAAVGSLFRADLSVAVWAYAAVAVALLALVWAALRRRGVGRRRKRLSLGWLANLGCTRDEAYSVEDGYVSDREHDRRERDAPFGKPRAPAGRLRLWSRRVTHMLRPNTRRHVSMPHYPLSNTASLSQPGSPRAASGANSLASSTSYFPSRSASMLDVTAPPSPPRTSARSSRPARPRQASSPMFGDSGGWNDPPLALFRHATQAKPRDGHESSSADDDWRPKRVRTPGPETLSRNSSRVNLSDVGLAQRASRAATPMDATP